MNRIKLKINGCDRYANRNLLEQKHRYTIFGNSFSYFWSFFYSSQHTHTHPHTHTHTHTHTISSEFWLLMPLQVINQVSMMIFYESTFCNTMLLAASFSCVNYELLLLLGNTLKMIFHLFNVFLHCEKSLLVL
jgi:hypothetical protein